MISCDMTNGRIEMNGVSAVDRERPSISPDENGPRNERMSYLLLYLIGKRAGRSGVPVSTSVSDERNGQRQSKRKGPCSVSCDNEIRSQSFGLLCFNDLFRLKCENVSRVGCRPCRPACRVDRRNAGAFGCLHHSQMRTHNKKAKKCWRRWPVLVAVLERQA
jgi:hypothetical protein